MDHFAKIISWYDSELGKVEEFLLDIDISDKTSEDAAKAIQHSLKKLFPQEDIKLAGITTDSGGGGTLESLAAELKKLDLCTPDFLVLSCSLHNLQTCLRNAVVEHLDEGGKTEKGEFKRNVMQLLHGMYNVQTYLEGSELKQKWNIICHKLDITKKFKRLPQPVLTRWWYVGVCAACLLEDLEVWEALMQGIRNDPSSSGHAINDIASSNKSLLQEPMILSDLRLLDAFHKFWVTPHFKFLQGGDLVSNKSGYQVKHVLERFFIMHDDLKQNMQGKWKNNTHFSKFVQHLTTLTEAEKLEQEKKVESMFVTAHKSLLKNFNRYSNHLLVCSLGGESMCAQQVAKFLLGQEMETMNITYNSEFHDHQIDICRFAKFIRETCTTLEQVRTSNHLTQFSIDAIVRIANGEDVWSDSPHPSLLSFKNTFLNRYIPIASNTQMTERGVKEGTLCSTATRGEMTRSVYAVARSGFVERAGDLSEEIKLESNEEVKRDDRFRGHVKGQANITTVIRQHNFVERFRKEHPEEYNAAENRATTYLGENKGHFRETRIAEKVDLFTAHLDKDRAPNRFERLRGYTRTQRSQGKVQITKLTKGKHERVIELELTARGIHFDPKDNWTTKKNKLIEHEDNQEDKRFFVPRTSIDAFVLT